MESLNYISEETVYTPKNSPSTKIPMFTIKDKTKPDKVLASFPASKLNMIYNHGKISAKDAINQLLRPRFSDIDVCDIIDELKLHAEDFIKKHYTTKEKSIAQKSFNSEMASLNKQLFSKVINQAQYTKAMAEIMAKYNG